VDIVSKGGNYLLNVGPTSDGVIPPASQDVLRTAGRWLQVNGDAVYGAAPTPFGDELGEISKTLKDVRGEPMGFVQADFRYTARPGKLYITFFTEPRVPFPLPAMRNTVSRAYYLGGDRGAVPIKVRTENGRTILDIERPIPDPMASVVVVEVSGTKIEPIR
jgi:alpha-L-fucosidase